MLQLEGALAGNQGVPQMKQLRCLPQSDPPSIIKPKTKFSHLQRCAAAGVVWLPTGNPGR